MPVNLQDLNNLYPNGELSMWEGDPELRRRVFSPVFANLYQGKVVYHENFTSIIRVQNIEFSSGYFNATAMHHLSISRGRLPRYLAIPQKWSIASAWSCLHISGNMLTNGYTWHIWTDPELVEEIEKLVLEERYDEAMKRTVKAPYGGLGSKGKIF